MKTANDLTLNAHQVDDELIITADDALSIFREKFQSPITRVWVHEDGKVMTYRIRSRTLAFNYQRQANNLIRSLNLPLEATIEEWSVKDIIFEINLEIKSKKQ